MWPKLEDPHPLPKCDFVQMCFLAYFMNHEMLRNLILVIIKIADILMAQDPTANLLECDERMYSDAVKQNLALNHHWYKNVQDQKYFTYLKIKIPPP